ncbi:MAG: SpoIIE family protein phosphatase [Leptospira sp.]|nr:SpoIIE family protein phosphatase [Leptospira sp.]
MKEIIKIIKPGIRAKLIFFTVVLLATFGVISFVYFGYQQKQWSQDIFEKEIHAPLSYINSLSLDMDNLADTLVLIQDVKSRIKSKESELKKNKQRVVRKVNESSYFGLISKSKSKVYYRDTYFSEYLSETEINDLLEKVKNQFRDENGISIDKKKFDYFLLVAFRVAKFRSIVDSYEIKPDKSEREDRILNANKKYLSREMKNLRTLIQNFFRNRNKFNIEELGFNPRNVRIQTFDKEKNLFLDTGILIDGSSFSSRRLLSMQEFKEDRSKLLDFTAEDLISVSSEKEKQYSIGKNYFDLVARPFFKNPLLTERSKLILSDIDAGNSLWIEYVRKDIQISYAFSELVGRMRERRNNLIQDSIPPYKDKEYNSLYKEYNSLLKERLDFYKKNHPYPDENTKRRKSINDSISDYKDKAKALEESIKGLTDQANALRKLDKEDQAVILESKADEMGSDLESVNEEIAQLKITLNSWSEYPRLKLAEAYQNMREAALKSHIMLPYRNDSLAYEKFLRDNSIFFPEHRRWSHIRQWIMSGKSETEIPLVYIPKRGKVPVFEDGILFRSRMEAEEYMWFLDSTPIYSYPETDKSLVHILLFKSLAGFNIILLDKTESTLEMKNSLNQLLKLALGIGMFFLLIAIFASNYAVRKIRKIAEVTSLVGDGNLNVEFPKTGWDEIGSLGRTLNHMVSGLREREELRGELEAAEEIQKRLLPDRLPDIKGLEFGSFYKAMHGVGGDYFDFIELEDRVYLVVGDVSNHGVGPALVMALLRSQLHGLIRRGIKDPVKLLLELNSFLYAETPDTIFVTLFLGVFLKESNSLVYASAGHNKPVVYRDKDKKCKLLKAGGLPLGMDDNEFFQTTIELRKTILEKGDFFFQFTDGVNEAMNEAKEQYGNERLYKFIGDNQNLNSHDLLQAIAKDVENFTGKKIISEGPNELNDDIAMIGLRVL